MYKKNRLMIVMILFLSFFLFSACLFLNAKQPLEVEKIEFIDSTHFNIYCTGYGADGGLPDDDYIIVSDEYTKYEETKKTHKVENVSYNYTLFISIGVIAECEVSPSFESGEKVVVWLDSPFEETYGYSEFTVP